MTKKTITLVVMVLLLALVGSSEAQELFPPQIKYELEIWELLTEEEHQFALDAFEWQSERDVATFGFEVLTSPNLSTILSGIPIQLTARSTEEQLARVATPGILVRLGQQARLRVVEETLLREMELDEPYYKLDGIELVVSPLAFDDQREAVYTSFEIKTYQPSNRVRTSVWLIDGERTPIVMMRLTNAKTDRFFALYVRTEKITDPPTESTITIGGLGGLDTLFWPAEVQLKHDNYVWVALPLNPLATPEAAFKVWTTPGFYIDGALRGSTFDSHLGLGLQLFPEGLNLETRLITDGDQHFVAVGFSDHLEAFPGLVLSGGFMPGVFELSDFQRSKMRWWGEAELNSNPLSLRMRYLSAADNAGTIESEVGYDFAHNYNLFARLSMNQKNGNKVATGMRLTF